MKTIKLINLVGVGLGLWLAVWALYGSIGDQDTKWMALSAFYLAGVCLAGWGLWRLKLWALRLSRLLALLSLSLGIYVTYFRWDFWIFETPTLQDRLHAVTLDNPSGLSLIFISLVWLIYTLLPKTKKQYTLLSTDKQTGNKICPVCKEKSTTIGPKMLKGTLSSGSGVRGGSKFFSKIMCDACNVRYQNGELTLEDFQKD